MNKSDNCKDFKLSVKERCLENRKTTLLIKCIHQLLEQDSLNIIKAWQKEANKAQQRFTDTTITLSKENFHG